MSIRDGTIDPLQIADLIAQAKRLAKEYRRQTGRPLGITGEVAEFEAARLLGLRLSPPRQAGYDAVDESAGRERKLQIKGRVVRADSNLGQRLGRITFKDDWDAVLLVLLDEDLEPTAIFEAERVLVQDALAKPGSLARNERDQLGIGAFKRLARQVWPLPS